MATSIFAPVFLLGVLIFVHELGHFLVAKYYNIKVTRFALGFGPALIRFQKGETEYALCAFPLGGYVKLVGQDETEDIPSEDRDRSFFAKPLYQRVLVVLAGPAANLVFPVLILFVVLQLPRPMDSSEVGSVIPGSPAGKAGLQAGDRIRAINGREINLWDEVKELIGGAPGQAVEIVVDRGGKDVALSLTPEIREEKNIAGDVVREGRIGVAHVYQRPNIGVVPGGPAARAGLKTWDRVLEINGKPVTYFEEVPRLLEEAGAAAVTVMVERPENLETLIQRKRMDSSGAMLNMKELKYSAPIRVTFSPELQDKAGVAEPEWGIESASLYVLGVDVNSPAEALGLRTGDRLESLNGQPLRSFSDFQDMLMRTPEGVFRLQWSRAAPAQPGLFAELGQLAAAAPQTPRPGILRMEGDYKGYPVTARNELDENQTRYKPGLYTFLDYKAPDPIIYRAGIAEAAVAGVTRTVETCKLMAQGIWWLLTGKVSHKQVGGPIMIFSMAGKAAQTGWDAYIGMMIVISINLGLLNLLPVPVLDGGHLALFAIEGVRRKPLSPRIRHAAQTVGLVLLMALMVLALKNDVTRYLIG
ncbi:MAG: hypothetical protein GMKNLPBB_02159 [Myxococcota bacterium]|nr:hypothetical protein [Myxococcota bacterium]